MARKPAVDPLLLGNQICFAVYSTAHAFNRVYKPLLDRHICCVASRCARYIVYGVDQ